MRRPRQPLQGGRQAAADSAAGQHDAGGQADGQWRFLLPLLLLLLLLTPPLLSLLLLRLLPLLLCCLCNCCRVGHRRHQDVAAAERNRQPAHPAVPNESVNGGATILECKIKWSQISSVASAVASELKDLGRVDSLAPSSGGLRGHHLMSQATPPSWHSATDIRGGPSSPPRAPLQHHDQCSLQVDSGGTAAGDSREVVSLPCCLRVAKL